MAAVQQWLDDEVAKRQAVIEWYYGVTIQSPEAENLDHLGTDEFDKVYTEYKSNLTKRDGFWVMGK